MNGFLKHLGLENSWKTFLCGYVIKFSIGSPDLKWLNALTNKNQNFNSNPFGFKAALKHATSNCLQRMSVTGVMAF